jgi:hypothetical protein
MRSWRLTASVMGNIQGFFFFVVARSLVSAGGFPHNSGCSITLLGKLHDCSVFRTHSIEVLYLNQNLFSPFSWPVSYFKFVVATIKQHSFAMQEIFLRRLSTQCGPSTLSCALRSNFTWNNSGPTWRIFIKYDIWVFFVNRRRKFKFH